MGSIRPEGSVVRVPGAGGLHTVEGPLTVAFTMMGVSSPLCYRSWGTSSPGSTCHGGEGGRDTGKTLGKGAETGNYSRGLSRLKEKGDPRR